MKLIQKFRWDDKYHTFKLQSHHTVKGSAATHYIVEDDLDSTTFGTASGSSTFGDASNDNAHKNGVDLWQQCFDSLKQRSCEYSSGVCYVEERRVWGYVTQVSESKGVRRTHAFFNSVKGIC